jgi:transposase
MKQLFELALQLEPPWRVVSSDIDFDRRRVDLRLGFRAGSRFPCPQCGRACQAVEFTEGTWRQPDMMAFEAFVTARLPSIRCPEHGDVALMPSWASDNVSLQALIRDEDTGHLRDTSAHASSRDARPTRSSGRARR